MMKCYIVDDEQHAVDALVAMLRKKFNQKIDILGSTTSALTAIEEIESLSPDIVFLDVEMPEMTGLELLKHFPEREFAVIFTTAHEKYALPALKASATDYLVKPLSPQDVFDAIQKCTASRTPRTEPKEMLQRLSLNTSKGMLVVNTDDIIRIEAQNNYSYFYFTNRERIIISKTLREYDDQLADHNFFRAHQSHLVNLRHVVSVHNNDGDYALLTNGHRVEISRRKKAEFLQKFRGA